ncbi:hypothetical protein BGLT_06526 [Caballeronia glathei]|nr:hypothetical protein BGLT_06526 [Caballeronia glathei]
MGLSAVFRGKLHWPAPNTYVDCHRTTYPSHWRNGNWPCAVLPEPTGDILESRYRQATRAF